MVLSWPAMEVLSTKRLDCVVLNPGRMRGTGNVARIGCNAAVKFRHGEHGENQAYDRFTGGRPFDINLIWIDLRACPGFFPHGGPVAVTK